jgi:hypothetical protein
LANQKHQKARFEFLFNFFCVGAAAKIFLCDLGCAPKRVGTRNSSTCLALQLATAGLQLAAVMMTRTRMIQRRTSVGSSDDGASPDNSTLYAGKV